MSHVRTALAEKIAASLRAYTGGALVPIAPAMLDHCADFIAQAIEGGRPVVTPADDPAQRTNWPALNEGVRGFIYLTPEEADARSQRLLAERRRREQPTLDPDEDEQP